MKTSKTQKNTTSNSHSSKPFFSKSGSFFSQTKEPEKPFFNPYSIQTKLAFGQLNDKYEQEADTMAEEVVSQIKSSKSVPTIQSKCEACEEEEKLHEKKENNEMEEVMRKPIFESGVSHDDYTQSASAKPFLLLRNHPVSQNLQLGSAESPEEYTADQFATKIMSPIPSGKPFLRSSFNKFPSSNSLHRKASNTSSQSQIPDFVRQVLSSSGRPMDNANRLFFETRIGADLNNIRIYTGEMAGESAKAIGAEAYTVGNRIVFGRGKYQPGTNSGRRLLAHELGHSVSAEISGGSSNAERTLICRSIQSGGIRSTNEVLEKVRRTVRRTRRYNSINLGPHAQKLTELYRLGEAFHPGGEIDLPSNNFVFTCNCGWLDIGHFFFTALAGYIESLGIRATPANPNWSTISRLIAELNWPDIRPDGALRAYETSLQTEEQQQQLRERLEAGEHLTTGQIGTAQSAFTLEDLRSNWEGSHFGQSATGSSFDILTNLQAVFSSCRPPVLPLPPINQRGNIQNFHPSVQRLIRETIGNTQITINGTTHALPRQQFLQDRTTRPEPIELMEGIDFCPGPGDFTLTSQDERYT